ncbi:Uncharacterised protein [Mycobacteroides abscessus subsp. abscessus]|nr:Uncharacterised protein [Mycobacteroides abscessus subsp. abscessus]
MVDLRLVRAFDGERDRLVEGEGGSAVEADEAVAVEFEDPRDDLAAHPGEVLVEALVRVAFDRDDAGVREDGAVELHRLLGAVSEPETRNDRRRHGLSSGRRCRAQRHWLRS